MTTDSEDVEAIENSTDQNDLGKLNSSSESSKLKEGNGKVSPQKRTKRILLMVNAGVALVCVALLIFFSTTVFKFADYVPQEDPTLISIKLEGLDYASTFLSHSGSIYNNLDVPTKNGKIFAGWYETKEGNERVSSITPTPDEDSTLFARWEDIFTGIKLPILSFESFTNGSEAYPKDGYPIDRFLRLAQDLKEQGYYFPTWKEVISYSQQRCLLPEKSIILTTNQYDRSVKELLEPVLDKAGVLMTSFVVTDPDIAQVSDGQQSQYLLLRSQGNKIYKKGLDGIPVYRSWTQGEIQADIDASSQVLGIREVYAYPDGEYDEVYVQALTALDFRLAVTKADTLVGGDSSPMALPRLVIGHDDTVEDILKLIR
jgi:uncharacterized repeat protein (TIGR02543 family)